MSNDDEEYVSHNDLVLKNSKNFNKCMVQLFEGFFVF